MATTANMTLVLPDVSVTIGPDWATILNTALERLDGHTHETGYGVQINQNGINITGDLTFADSAATNVAAVGLTRQASDPSASYKPMLYSKLVSSVYELHYMDSAGNIARLTNTGAVYGGSVTANSFPTNLVALDTVIAAGSTYSHYGVDASVANRIITLPRASDVGDGRFFYISDHTGSCSSSRTITVQVTGGSGDTFDSGSSSFTIEVAYGWVLCVRTSTSTWRVYRQHALATTAAIGSIKLTNDLGGTAHLPTVMSLTGTGAGGYTEVKSVDLRFSESLTSPNLYQDDASGGTGTNMYIRAQSGVTTGGDLILRGGFGATEGSVVITSGSGFDEILAAIPGGSPYLRVTGTGGVKFSANHASPSISQEARTSSGAGAALAITAQSGNTSGDGGSISLTAGDGAGAGSSGGSINIIAGESTDVAGGSIQLTAGTTATGDGGPLTLSGGAKGAGGMHGPLLLQLAAGTVDMITLKEVAASRFVVGLCGDVDSTMVPGGDGVVFIADKGAAPSTNPATQVPTGGLVMYSDAGQLAIKQGGASGMTFKFGTGVGTGIASLTTSGATTSSSGTSYSAYLRVTINGTDYRIGLYT